MDCSLPDASIHVIFQARVLEWGAIPYSELGLVGFISGYLSVYAQQWDCWVIWQFLEKAVATHSSTLAWKIPWMEEPGRLQSMGSLRVGQD